MAQLEHWFTQDLKSPVKVHHIAGNMFSQDNKANKIGVRVFKDGDPVTLSGTISANVVRPDDGTVAVASGTISGNEASVVLPQAAYAYPGIISVIIKLTNDTKVTTLCAVTAIVYQSSTDTIIDPGTILPDIQSLIDEMEEVRESIPVEYTELTEQVSDLEDEVENLEPKSTVYGKLIKVIDAKPGEEAIYIPSGSEIRSMNMYPIHATNRTTNGITFTVDSNDHNTLTFNGTATANAYSYTTITESNAILFHPGIYYLKTFGSKNRTVWLYYDFIVNGEKTAHGLRLSKTCNGVSFELTEDTYVAWRIQVQNGTVVNNETVSVMYSAFSMEKWYPYTYSPYFEPRTDGIFPTQESVVINANDSDYVTYKVNPSKSVVRMKVGTFNVGDYSGNGGSQGDVDVPTGNLQDYLRYVSSLNADILCTQEDREYWDISSKTPTFDELYSNCFTNSVLVSKALSHGDTMAKAIYSNYQSLQEGRYTFTNKGVNPDTGTNFWNSFTYAVYKISDRIVMIVSVHLSAKSNNVAVRKLQITEMLNFISNFSIDHVIICGDFNVWEDEYDTFDSDKWTLANCGAYGDYKTFDSQNDHCFDNIIVSNGVLVSNIEVHDNGFHDHYALTATVTIS